MTTITGELKLRYQILVHQYGPLLNLEQLGELFKIEPGTVDKRIRAGDFPVPTRKEGGKRVADALTVARYLAERAADDLEPRAAGSDPLGGGYIGVAASSQHAP